MRQLIIDPEFRDKIPPLSQDEFSKLEENIIADGEVMEPLVVWHNTIIDGHHRWTIIQKHPEIPYKIKQMDFPDKWAAIVWMCRNQLGRRNITDEQKTALIGEAYKAQKMTQGGDRKSSAQSEHLKKQRTSEVIATDFGVGRETVKRAEHFVDGLDSAEKVSPGIKEAVLSGEIKAPKNLVAEIRNTPEEARPAVVEAIKQGEISDAKKIIEISNPKSPKDLEPPKAPEETPFTPEELGELIDAAANNLDFSLNLHLVLTHRDVLDREDGRAAAVKAINRAISVANKYLDMIRRIEENGAEN